MASHTILANTSSSTTGSKLRRGRIKIHTNTAIYWAIGEHPVASKNGCALLPAGESIELRIPVNCSKIAVLAVHEEGSVIVIEIPDGAKASCSS